MTVIAYKDGVLAADTVTSFVNTKVRGKTKIGRREDGTLYASAGDGAEGDLFKKWVAEGEQGKPPRCKNSDGLIVRPDGEIFHYRDGGFTNLRSPYFALGSGMDVALGAMFANGSAVQACYAAMEHAEGCGGEVEWVTHDGGKPDKATLRPKLSPRLTTKPPTNWAA